jgi:hypothetical protein
MEHIFLDTCTIVAATTPTTSKDAADLRKRGIDPERLRGQLIRILLDKEKKVHVPQKVVEELTAHKKHVTDSAQLTALQDIGDHFKFKGVPFIPRKEDLNFQKEIFERIERKAKTSLPPNTPENWQVCDPKDLPADFEENPYCKFIRKNYAASLSLPKVPDGEKTIQERKLTEYVSLTLEKTNPNLSAKEKKEMSDKLDTLEKWINATPYMLPDMKILLLARRHNGRVFSLDTDFEVMVAIMEELKIPNTKEVIKYRPVAKDTMENLVQTIQKTVTKDCKKTLEGNFLGI